MKTIILSDTDYSIYKLRMAGYSLTLNFVSLCKASEEATKSLKDFQSKMELPK